MTAAMSSSKIEQIWDDSSSSKRFLLIEMILEDDSWRRFLKTILVAILRDDFGICSTTLESVQPRWKTIRILQSHPLQNNVKTFKKDQERYLFSLVWISKLQITTTHIFPHISSLLLNSRNKNLLPWEYSYIRILQMMTMMITELLCWEYIIQHIQTRQ